MGGRGRGSVGMIGTSAVGHLVVVRNWQFLAWGSENSLIRDKIIHQLCQHTSSIIYLFGHNSPHVLTFR